MASCYWFLVVVALEIVLLSAVSPCAAQNRILVIAEDGIQQSHSIFFDNLLGTQPLIARNLMRVNRAWLRPYFSVPKRSQAATLSLWGLPLRSFDYFRSYCSRFVLSYNFVDCIRFRRFRGYKFNC